MQKTYSYTAHNLLESVQHSPGGPSSLMAWDGDGNRVSFTSSAGGTWYYVYDPTAAVPAVVEEITPSGTVYYIREPSGGLIARVAGESVRYYHFDALGSTVMLTDGSGAVTDKYSYDAWGNANHFYGTTEQPYQYVGEWGYYTHYQDENLGLLQLGLRFYDPETAGFTQRDPVEDGLNSYAYVAGRPTTATDPSGLWIETGLDILGTAWDVGDFIEKPTWAGAGWIALDVVGLVLPVVPSAGAIRRVGRLDEPAQTVYKLLKNDQVVYIGRTVDFRARELRHLSDPLKDFDRMVPVAKGLTKNQSTGLEQYLIEVHGLENLLNKRNEISKTARPEYYRKWTEWARNYQAGTNSTGGYASGMVGAARWRREDCDW